MAAAAALRGASPERFDVQHPFPAGAGQIPCAFPARFPALSPTIPCRRAGICRETSGFPPHSGARQQEIFASSLLAGNLSRPEWSRGNRGEVDARFLSAEIEGTGGCAGSGGAAAVGVNSTGGT